MRRSKRTTIIACLWLTGLGVFAPALSQEAEPEERKLGWFDVGEFSFVYTSGNSQNSTLGLKNKLSHVWERSSFEINAGAIRSETQVVDAFAIGSPDDFEVQDGPETTTAEFYFLNGRYDRKITDTLVWFAGGGWERNEPSGIENRYTGFGGLGNIWSDDERIKFRTDYAASYTKEDPLVEPPDFDDAFFGFRFSWAYWHKFGETTVYTNDFIIDWNLEDTDDVRGDMTNAVAVAMSSHLALKVSLRWLYDHQPALKEIPIYDASDFADGTLNQVGTTLVELDELDTIFTASLVVNF